MNPAMPMSTRTPVRSFLLLSVVLTCMVMLLSAPPAYAQRHAIGSIVVPSGVTAPDVSTAVGDVTVDGAVEGDVETGRGNILLNGPVGGDVRSTLGNLDVNAPVNGDIDAEVGNVSIDSEVDGDIDVGNGDVILGPHAFVEGDVECGNGRIIGNGNAVQGNVTAGMASGLDSFGGGPHGPGILGFLGWLLLALVFMACTVLVSVMAPGTLNSVTRSLGGLQDGRFSSV